MFVYMCVHVCQRTMTVIKNILEDHKFLTSQYSYFSFSSGPTKISLIIVFYINWFRWKIESGY